jgi:hypothetical protein
MIEPAMTTRQPKESYSGHLEKLTFSERAIGMEGSLLAL